MTFLSLFSRPVGSLTFSQKRRTKRDRIGAEPASCSYIDIRKDIAVPVHDPVLPVVIERPGRQGAVSRVDHRRRPAEMVVEDIECVSRGGEGGDISHDDEGIAGMPG